MNCLICGGALSLLGAAIVGYRRGTSYEIAHCFSCNTKCALPLKSDDRIYENIYSQVERVSGYSRYFQIAKAVQGADHPLDLLMRQEEAYWGVATQIADLVRANENIVELGCGQGYLTYSLVRAGYNVIGLDISNIAVDLARSRYGDLYRCSSIENYIQDVGESPKCVVMSEVIEHLENPIAVIKSAYSALAPGGSLIITTPNMDAYPGAIWDTDLPPVHLFWFSPQSFRRIGETLGAEVEFFNFNKYYKRFPKIKYDADAGRGDRPPILAESGEILQEKTSRSIDRDFRNRLPRLIAAPAIIINAYTKGMQLFSSEKPGTICVTLNKYQ
jgi:2-polyprenyl-3-methyl-5-hydroxy-6-metoxy-1,4-benzoquinol methylase